ncbi:hypothetical protein [Dactylosporangium fulvum]|uniref:Uncharacterized protein n=1 Tax=Dactylosporangium fulvum TaxID=53359 RepID=A0ABY5VZZ2_9ACTN|nr:hypothetical protein [Dactylosporangium fulvum]UWP83245.1 hypothetical protein Dfulv_02770 [Dactylosporangium fulvum]
MNTRRWFDEPTEVAEPGATSRVGGLGRWALVLLVRVIELVLDVWS